MPEGSRFRARLSDLALEDFEGIVEWSLGQFGHDAMLRYENLIHQGLLDLEDDPLRPGSKILDGLPGGTRMYHIAFSRARARSSLGIVKHPRHVVLYRLERGVISILRLLHDAQEPGRYVPDAE